jgi:hypothetical protein
MSLERSMMDPKRLSEPASDGQLRVSVRPLSASIRDKKEAAEPLVSDSAAHAPDLSRRQGDQPSLIGATEKKREQAEGFCSRKRAASQTGGTDGPPTPRAN